MTEVAPPQKHRKKLSCSSCLLVAALAVLACLFGYFIGYNVGWKVAKDMKYIKFDFGSLSRTLQEKVDRQFLRDQLQLFGSQIHQAGSIRNQRLADTMKKNWDLWGLKSSKIDQYTVNKTVVSSVLPNNVRILYNKTIIHSMVTVELSGLLPVYHSYSSPGYAKGKFVFINYGRMRDLDLLDRLNVSYCGKSTIPIVRLGFSFRSAKVKNIRQKCVGDLPAGMLVYPDPWDFSVDPLNKSSTPSNTPVYPKSWWLPGDAAVFGNMKMVLDLQNPDLPSLDGIYPTVNFSDMQTPFPVQPISYNDAAKLFKYMKIGSVPKTWKNCLPDFLKSSNHYEVEMIIKNRVEPVVLSNVIGVIPGEVDDDRYVILGNHRDAWAMGASDPVSGTIILQQVVKILSEAYKNGKFKPFRTILFTNWDGEEEQLIGSTEFTNQFSSKLFERCVAYINIDCPIKGSWSFNGRATPLMIGPMLESSQNVHINTNVTLFDDWLRKYPNKFNLSEPRVNFLGGGSDHIPFAYVLGIPSAYPEYRYKQRLFNTPTYHTQYDNIDMMLRFIDPGLQNHKTVAQFVLDYIIRLSYSPILPYSMERLVDLLIDSFSDLKKEMESIDFIRESNYSSIIRKQLIELQKVSLKFQCHIDSGKPFSSYLKVRKINDVLLLLPRMFLTRDGLPNRKYLKNILLAPKIQNAYQGSVYTGIYDSIYLFAQGKIKQKDVLRQMSLLSNSLRKAINLLSVDTF